MTKNQKWARLRLGLYALTNAGLGVAVVYNIVDGQQSAAWLLLGNAALTVAFFNVDTSGDEGEVPDYWDGDLDSVE